MQEGEQKSVVVKEDAGDSQPIGRQVIQTRQREARTLHQANLLKHRLKNVQPARGLQMDRSCEDHQQVSIERDSNYKSYQLREIRRLTTPME